MTLSISVALSLSVVLAEVNAKRSWINEYNKDQAIWSCVYTDLARTRDDMLLYCIVSSFISKTWLTKRSHLQDKWTKLKQKHYLLKSLQCTGVRYWVSGGLVINVLDCESRGQEFKSAPGQKFANSSMTSALTIYTLSVERWDSEGENWPLALKCRG